MFNVVIINKINCFIYFSSRAQSALAVSGAVVGVVRRSSRNSLAVNTLTTEAQIVHSDHGSDSRSIQTKTLLLVL